MTDIEDRLRSYGAQWRDGQPAPEGPDLRDRTRHVAVLVTLVAVVGLVVGAAVWAQGGSNHRDLATRSAGDGLVPWADDPATPPAPTTGVPPAGVRACQPQDVTVGAAESGGAAGSSVWSVPLTNRSGDACTLPLVPAVTAVNGAGQRVTVEEGGEKAGPPMPLEAGHNARLLFQTANTCDGAGQVLPTERYREVELGLGTGTLAVAGVEPVLCGPQLAGKVIVDFPPIPPEPGSVASLGARIEEPVAPVEGGKDLRYVVVLTNQTATAVDLSNGCPVYTQIVSTGRATETHSYRLNCAAAGSSIPAQGERRFAMVVAVPDVTDMAKLSWQVAPDGPSAGTAVTIT